MSEIPPPPPSQKKKPGCAKIGCGATTGLALLFVALVVFANMMMTPEERARLAAESEKARIERASQEKVSEHKQGSDSPSLPAEAPVFKAGDPIKLGDYTYKVTGVKSHRSIGNDFASKHAADGAIFVVVSFTILNETNETQTVLANDFKLIDEKGREFQPSSDGLTALTMSGGAEFLVSQLQPGIVKKTMTVFELPSDALQSPLLLVIPEKGWGSGKAKVRFSVE